MPFTAGHSARLWMPIGSAIANLTQEFVDGVLRNTESARTETVMGILTLVGGAVLGCLNVQYLNCPNKIPLAS